MILITHGSLRSVCYMNTFGIQIGLVIFYIVQTLGKLSKCCFSKVVADNISKEHYIRIKRSMCITCNPLLFYELRNL